MPSKKRTISDAEARVLGWEAVGWTLRENLNAGVLGVDRPNFTTADTLAIARMAKRRLRCIEEKARRQRAIFEHRRRLAE